jgi:NAD(P)-dependent dehydrogenase (short-subunit alcohol dehydrogenase family)
MKGDGLAIVVGASQGLGLDVARSLHGDGWSVVTLSRTAPSEAPPWQHDLVDAADPAQVDAFFARWGDRFGDRNLLVNFAGARYNVSIVDSDPLAWRACVDSSLYTTYLMTRGFARASAGRPGAIVNMASIHAAGAAPGRSAYASAKAAVEQLTALSAIELTPLGIRVNCVAPGFIRTEASASMIASGALDGAAIERRTPLGRLGEPGEITDVVRFLLSDESRFVTGETIRADGGWLRHAEV